MFQTNKYKAFRRFVGVPAVEWFKIDTYSLRVGPLRYIYLHLKEIEEKLQDLVLV